MPQRTTISTDAAPEAIGTYRQAVRVGDTVYLSGQIPLVADTMELVSSAIDAQIEQVISNLRAVAEAAGGSLDEFVRVTVFLTDMGEDFEIFNGIYSKYFGETRPCRTTVEVGALPTPIRVELKCVAWLGERS